MKQEGKQKTYSDSFTSIRNAVAKSSEQYFLFLYSIYVISNVIVLVNFQRDIFHHVWTAHFVMFSIVMWGTAFYLFSILVEWRNAWRNTLEIIVIGVAVILFIGLLSKSMTTDSYKYIMGCILCLLAYGRNYRKILKCLLIIIVGVLFIGWIGMPLGFTLDAVKPNRVYGGHSLGIMYPNDWGYFFFLIITIIWYLWLKQKGFISLLLFWATAIFMYKYITCQTIAILTFIFPLIALVAEFLQRRCDKIFVTKKASSIAYWLILISPFVVFGVMIFLCLQMDWIHDHFYGTRFTSAAMRFVEGGYSLKLNGISLFGHPFKQWEEGIVDYEERIQLIVDSAFIAYLIIRGVIWMLVTLLWITLAHFCGIKKKDYRIIAISIIFLVFSIMERPGLDVWYNYVLLYPLASLSFEEDQCLKQLTKQSPSQE